MKNITLIAFAAWFTVACTSTESDVQVAKKQPQPAKSVASTPAKYCQSVDGKVKTVEGSRDAFCILPSGDVVKLQEFYNQNHQ